MRTTRTHSLHGLLELCLTWYMLLAPVSAYDVAAASSPDASSTSTSSVVEGLPSLDLHGLAPLAEEGESSDHSFWNDTSYQGTTVGEGVGPLLKGKLSSAQPQDVLAGVGAIARLLATEAPQEGDFQALNGLLRHTVIALPDADIQEMVLFQPLAISMRTLEVSKIALEDLKLENDLRSKQEAGVGFSLVNLALTVEFDFDWSYIFLVGNGHAVVKVGESSAQAGLDFFSEDFDHYPPTSANVTNCTTDINIEGIEFSGNVASEIFNMFEALILDVVNGMLNDLLCVTISDEIGSDLLADGLSMVYDLVIPYLQPVEDWRYNLTYPELTMEVPKDVDLVSWNDDDGYGQFMAAAFDELDSMLGGLQEDLTVPNGTLAFPNGTLYPNGTDLGINVMLRNYLLDEDRSLSLNRSTLESDYNTSTVLVASHDELTETNISIISLKVDGLDTFRVMEPFQRYGNFTLQNKLSWEYLSFEVGIKLEVKASSLNNSLIRDPERVQPYVEEIKVTIGVEDLQTVIGLMVALDPGQMTQLRLGSLLELTSMLPCVVASLHDVALADLNVTIGDIQLPTLEGFVSPGVDRLLTDAAEIGFFMYKGTILQAIPTLCQSTVRDLITGLLDTLECPELVLDKKDSFIDLRDLLLDSAEARATGATGLAPYGDLAATVYTIGQQLWQEVEEDGTLGLNSLIIDPITSAISNESGLVTLPGELFNFTTTEQTQQEFKELVNEFRFAIYDLKIDNLDTIVHPMAIIQPIDHPYITQSTLNMGPLEGSPLNITVSMMMSLDIEDSPLAMDNIVNMGVSIASTEVFVEMFTMLSKNHFLNFKLGDAAFAGCWLGVLPPPELNERGYRVEGSTDRGLELRRFLAKFSELELAIDCVQCSPGLASLPELVDIFERSKVTEVLSYRVPLVLEEVAISEAMQVAFDRWLIDAPHGCPHRKEYDPDYERPSTWETPEFTQISVEATDSIFFAAMAAAEFGYVLLVETHYPWELSTLEPMSGQEKFRAPKGSNIIDFANLFEEFDKIADDARSYVGDTRCDNATGTCDLGINLVARNYLHNDDGVFDAVALLGGDPIEFSVEGVVVLIHSIKIRGLDTFTRFDIMKPIAPQTILNSMHMETLQINVTVSIGSRLEPEQHMSMSLSFKDLNATVPFFAAFDKNVLDSLELGHFLLSGEIFPCLLASAVDIHFPQILLTLGEFAAPTFSGFLPDSAEALRQSMDEVFGRYGERALKALPIMFDVSARTFINEFISDYISEKAGCTHLVDFIAEETPVGEEVYPFDGFVDFRELILRPENATMLGARGNTTYGDTIRSLLAPIQEEILAVNSRTGQADTLNSIIGPLTAFLSGENGVIEVPGDVFPDLPAFEIDIGALVLSIEVSLGDLKIENIDTIGEPLNLLTPLGTKPSHLKNSLGLGRKRRPFRVALAFGLSIKTFNEDSWNPKLQQYTDLDNEIRNDIVLTVAMEGVDALFTLLMKLSEDRMVHFPMEDVFNPYCWISLMPPSKLDEFGTRVEGESPSVMLADLALAVKKLNATIECVECSSPGMQGLIETLNKPESVDAVTELANGVLQLASQLITGNLVQDNLDRLLVTAARNCPHDPAYVEDAEAIEYEPILFNTSIETNSLVYLVSGVVLGLVVAIVLVTTVVKCFVKRRHQRWLRTLPVQKIHIVQHLQQADEQLEKELNADTASMIRSPEIPACLRYAMPLIVIANIAMFLSGHLSVAADVALTILIAGEDIPIERLYSFSIMKSTVDLWVVGTEEMAIFILIFSGIWPYAKQLLSLVGWLLPPEKLSISTRGSLFLWLDTLAKWSMVDIFVTLLYMVAFRVTAVTPDVVFLPSDFFTIEFYIIPKWGIYANLIAQMISQVSSHYIIHYHRLIVRKATKEYEARHAVQHKEKAPSVETTEDSAEPSGNSDEGSAKENRLCDSSFARPHKGESSLLVARRVASYGLVVVTFLLVLFIIIGCSLPTFSTEIQGIVGLITGTSNGEYNEYDLFDIIAMLYRDGIRLGGFRYIAGHLLLLIVLLITVFIIPLVQALALAFHWFRPMNDEERRKFSVVIEILGAWQYAEVFILASLVSAWQQGSTSETVMGDQCEEFNTVFEILAYYNILKREEAHCFRVEATIMSGTYFLLSGTVLLALLNTFVMKANFQYFWDKAAIRKEMAMDEHLTVKESLKEVDEDALKKIVPPPVLFTDTFRWLLRPEHLGDRPHLHGFIVGDKASELDDEEENISSASSGSWPKTPKTVDVDEMMSPKSCDVDELESQGDDVDC